MGIIKSLIKSIAKGFYWIGEGFSYISLYPKSDYKFYSDKEAFKKDYEAINDDWGKVGKVLESIINKY